MGRRPVVAALAACEVVVFAAIVASTLQLSAALQRSASVHRVAFAVAATSHMLAREIRAGVARRLG